MKERGKSQTRGYNQQGLAWHWRRKQEVMTAPKKSNHGKNKMKKQNNEGELADKSGGHIRLAWTGWGNTNAGGRKDSQLGEKDAKSPDSR